MYGIGSYTFDWNIEVIYYGKTSKKIGMLFITNSDIDNYQKHNNKSQGSIEKLYNLWICSTLYCIANIVVDDVLYFVFLLFDGKL